MAALGEAESQSRSLDWASPREGRFRPLEIHFQFHFSFLGRLDKWNEWNGGPHPLPPYSRDDWAKRIGVCLVVRLGTPLPHCRSWFQLEANRNKETPCSGATGPHKPRHRLQCSRARSRRSSSASGHVRMPGLLEMGVSGDRAARFHEAVVIRSLCLFFWWVELV